LASINNSFKLLFHFYPYEVHTKQSLKQQQTREGNRAIAPQTFMDHFGELQDFI